MPEYIYPGVYVEEAGLGPRPIEGVPTSTAAILGETERGSIQPRLVTGYNEYKRWFGGVRDIYDWVAYAVRGFFENGGQRVFISRIVGDAASRAEASFGDFIFRAAGHGSWGNRVFVKIEDGTTLGFRLRIAYWAKLDSPFDPFTDSLTLPRPDFIEVFDGLVADETSPNFFGKFMPFIDLDKGEGIQGPKTSALGILVRGAGVGAGKLPNKGGLFLSGGADDTAPLDVEDYAGLAANHRLEAQGLAALEMEACREVALVYAPNVSRDIAVEIVKHCEGMRFRFAIIDCPKGVSSASELSPRNQIADSEFAAFYYPWIFTPDLRMSTPTLVPPGGHVLGIYARTDVERGVFKAPANEILHGSLALEFEVNDNQQGDLNSKGVNVIRKLPGRGIRVWGARTMSSNPHWKYINVRRLFIYIERSLYEGTQWVVFEPNGDLLWARVADSIRLFLRTQWRVGAFAGRTEDEAFFVSCDRTTMSQDDVLNGRLICEVGVAVLRPAEFIIFRILQKTAEAERS